VNFLKVLFLKESLGFIIYEQIPAGASSPQGLIGFGFQ
jgi:hypothetical protein